MRLTNKEEFCDSICPNSSECEFGCDFKDIKDMYNKLKEYEDLEEEGLLLKLPCKIGDAVYIVGYKYRQGGYEKFINTGKFRYSDLDKLKKTVFLTKEEAEKALERLESTE